MFRGTTPTHVFNVSIDTSKIKEVKITYSQDDVVILTKRTADCEIEDGKIKTTLRQEDTFLFDCNLRVAIQIRVLTEDGSALTSELIYRGVGKCLDDEVLV